VRGAGAEMILQRGRDWLGGSQQLAVKLPNLTGDSVELMLLELPLVWD